MTNSRLFKICFAIFWWVSKPRDLNRKGGEEEKEFFRHPRRISGPRPVWTGSSYGKHALGRIGRSTHGVTSAFGTMRTSEGTQLMSAFGGKADIAVSKRHVCF